MNQLVKDGIEAIRGFAGDVDYGTARKLIVLWHEYETISRATRDAILDAFPERVERDPVLGMDFLPGVDCETGCEDCTDETDAHFDAWAAELGQVKP